MSEATLKMVSVHAARYSGSTWLCLMLGSHSQAFCVGEPNSMIRQGRPICRVHGEACGFWNRYEYPSSGNPLRQIAHMAESSLLVMSTPSKFVDEQFHQDMNPRMIQLVRDGRSVVASILRKDTKRSVRGATRVWKREMKRSERIATKYGPGRCLRVHYEKLRADTEAELRRICDFIKIDFQPGMLDPAGFKHHYLGGNRGTLFNLLRKRKDVDAAALEHAILQEADSGGPAWDLEFYKQAKQRDFAPKQRRDRLGLFELWGGWLNRKYGYRRRGGIESAGSR